MEQSCNLGAALLAYRMGYDKTVEWVRKFGFTQRTGLEKSINSKLRYVTEAAGRMPLKEMHERGSTLAQVGFGQSITITPLQLAAAYSSIANKGVYIAPHLLPDDQMAAPPETHRVCKEKTAKWMMDYMENCVMNGTGTASAIAGYRVGGKTGTAQKAVSGFGYSKGLHVGSFVGVMPMDDPQLVIVAVVDEPTAGYYGGVVAAPVVQVVGEKALKFMNILPKQGVGIPPKLKNKMGGMKKTGD
jgi:cell division protein FtsI/penicillin-binding protein 2